MGVVTVELGDDLDRSAALPVADDLLAVRRREEAFPVVQLPLHPRVVRDVRVALWTSHLQTWRFKLKTAIFD